MPTYLERLSDPLIDMIMNFVTYDATRLNKQLDLLIKKFVNDKLAILTHMQLCVFMDGWCPQQTRWHSLSCIYEQISCKLHKGQGGDSHRSNGERHFIPIHEKASKDQVYVGLRVDEFRDLYYLFKDVTKTTAQKNYEATKLFSNYRSIMNMLGFSFLTYGFFEDAHGRTQPYYLVAYRTMKIGPSPLYFYLEEVFYANQEVPLDMNAWHAMPMSDFVTNEINNMYYLTTSVAPKIAGNILFHREWCGVLFMCFSRCERQEWLDRSVYYRQRAQSVQFVDHLRSGQHFEPMRLSQQKDKTGFYSRCDKNLKEMDKAELGNLLASCMVYKSVHECYDSVVRITLPNHYATES